MENIHIIGAGVAGLVAAIELEKMGFAPTIIEKSNRIGGRLKTDQENNYVFDHGFQVLLTSYPAAQRYLDFDALELQRFLPGAIIQQQSGASTLGDPLRYLPFAVSTFFASVADWSDKWKVWKLTKEIKKVSIDSIFAEPEMDTMTYLREYGFSTKIIEHFFLPFYSGIFLEPELETSSRMFRFVFKMFAEGHAAIPKGGIAAIPQQLKSQLKKTTFLMDTSVERVEDDKIVLEDGTERASDFTIVATAPAEILPDQNVPQQAWQSCQNLYFQVPRSSFGKPIIGLLAERDTLINNYHFPSDLEDMPGRALLSVTVVKAHELSDDQLIEQVQDELKTYCGISNVTYLRKYDIGHALPLLEDLHYAPSGEMVRVSERVVLAGDYLANASLNAAMESGAIAAQQIKQ
ncbi:MAG: FAD-dependent oxidoreductase [Saprospiraceae bacterium]|nr:FAD-dependent oxidoreductase [Saprospiraceae bacterium]